LRRGRIEQKVVAPYVPKIVVEAKAVAPLHETKIIIPIQETKVNPIMHFPILRGIVIITHGVKHQAQELKRKPW
jgi:hypothetical protein